MDIDLAVSTGMFAATTNSRSNTRTGNTSNAEQKANAAAVIGTENWRRSTEAVLLPAGRFCRLPLFGASINLNE